MPLDPVKTKERTKRFREKHRERLNAQMRARHETERRAKGIPKRNPKWTPAQWREYHRQWRLRNPGKSTAAQKKWRESHIDQALKMERRRHQDNREKERLYAEAKRRAMGIKPKPPKLTKAEHNRRYRAKYPEKVKAARLRRIASNKERFLLRSSANTARRRIMKAKIPGSHTLKEWVDLCASFANCCVCCGKHSKESTLTRDHIIPIANPLCTDYISNIQPLCRSCNSRKGAKAIIDYRRTPVLS